MKKIIAIILLFISVHSFAQQRLSLQEAINIALQNSLQLQIARNDAEVAAIQNHISFAGGSPQVNATLNFTESATSVYQKFNTGNVIERSGTAQNLQTGITGSYLLYNGLRVVATQKRLQELAALGNDNLNLQIQNIIADVMIKYYDIVRQENYISTLDTAITLANKRLEIFNVRKSVGLSNNADVFQAQIDVNAAQQTKAQQILILEQAKVDLLNMMNLNPDSLITVSDTIRVDENINLETVQSAAEKNPQIVIAERQVIINQLIEKEVRAQRYPSVVLNGGFNFNRNKASAGQFAFNQNYGPFIGVGLQIPIFNGGLFARQEKAAKVNTRSAELLRQDLLLDLKANAVKTFKAYNANLQQLKTEKKNFDLAQQLINITNARFEVGVATIIEVREAQQSFVDAGFRMVNLNYAAKIAEIEMKRLAGTLMP